MIKGKELFWYIYDQEGCYDAKLHIAEMIALLGLSSLELEPVRREDGRVCETVEEYFCGLFFDENDYFLYENLILDCKLGNIALFPQEDKEVFLDLAKEIFV
ncbi:hypothetical protein N7452_003845 [Penicillium brevicompactum]|uniref:Uncharacterized protein n=1 Tax=Penicillium brevicompactum TaxID=5074 RepID=A0A9W9QUC5_PENBR|nr:hypothetical protein N7452_003845 [Penicillium brevicompactum]